jgi:multidrug efflux pump subunit AcrA (membrane-fusion protein)
VWVTDDKEGIRPVMVKLGIENGSKVEIASGLNEGDR